MGLGLISAICQARFQRYQGTVASPPRATASRCGPSLATARWTSPNRWPGISLVRRAAARQHGAGAARSLQRLDGPVRGSGNVVQELRDALRRRWHGTSSNACRAAAGTCSSPATARAGSSSAWPRAVDEFRSLRHRWPLLQPRALLLALSQAGGAGRQHVGPGHRALKRGGSRPAKVYAAYAAAVAITGQPTVILAQTTRGYGMVPQAGCQHLTRPSWREDLNRFRERWPALNPTQDLEELRYFHPGEDSSGHATSGASRPRSATMCVAAHRARPIALSKPDTAYVAFHTPVPGDRSISTTTDPGAAAQ